MSGYNDPYRYPREEHRGRDSPYRDERGGGRGEGERGGYGGGGYGQGGHRDYRDDRGYGGGGGRGRGWDDDGRDHKRGRYEDYDRPRGDNRSPFPPSGHATPPAPHGYSSYGQPVYPHQAHPSGHEQPRDGRAGSQPAAGGARKPVVPEAPSSSVILLGLPLHVNDALLRQFLEDMGASIDTTTVIFDRTTQTSKGFGFAKFSSVEHARAFVEPNFPSIPWREHGAPGQSDGMRIKINYSQKTGGWREDQGATARLTEDQRKAEGAQQGFYVNDGTKDIGTKPRNMLLLRGIDPLTSEEDILSALVRVGGRASQALAKGGIKRVMIVKDRASRSSWGFAFVEFDDLASDVLAAAFTPTLHPTGFRIRNSIVAASYAHENSFVPVYSPSAWSFRGDGNALSIYWDEKGFTQPYVPPPPPKQEDVMRNVPKGPRAHVEAEVDADMAAFFDDLEADLPPGAAEELLAAGPAETADPSAAAAAAPTLAPPAAALPPPGSVAPISIKPISAVPPAASASAVSSASASRPDTTVKSSAPPAAPAAAAPAAASASAVPLGGKEKKSDLIVSRKAAPNIAKWNVKAKEIRSDAPSPAAKPKAGAADAGPAAASAAASTSTTPQSSATMTSAPSAAATAAPAAAAGAVAFDDPEFEHGDPVSFVCLLCQRQFKSTNLAKPDVVAACATRKADKLKKHAAAAAASASTEPAAPSKPKYVDRAAARREALGQDDSHGLGGAGAGKKRKFDGPEKEDKAVVVPPNQNGLEESNAGRKMLEKMGWTAGGGLGASGDGRVDAVQAHQFQAGAGLGATKGVAVGSEDATTSMTYAERMREKAARRFEGAS
ncbi:hypothetical protein Rhopal_003925-T1 [Rhodotorula paludigena]|uniref:G-patch domain-containing protein n=1 Tax=Rhodotorula paludigena TaxID=86838 RepID=A0AAV5GMZ6_9BASI|nr:hypothetical protein Rhopal_003925-T1 [Rhodotorula paludigena]